jgi:hypothetical protein
MPATVQLDRKRGIRVTTITGVVQRDELLDAYALIVGDPAFSDVTRGLVDLRHGSVDELTTVDVQTYARLPALPRQSEMRLAVVATDPVAYGMSRMYAMFRENTLAGEAQVFQDYDLAVAWLLSNASPPS